jgi:hypothetical protein
VFAATSIVTLPLPVPDAPALTVIQEALLFAVQAHEGPAVTGIVRLPPAAAISSLVLLRAYVHGDPIWVTSTRRSLTPMPPLRVVAVGLGATRKLIVAPPCPAAVDVRLIQSTSAFAFHEHSRLIETVSAPSPPDAPMLRESEASVTAHCALVGAVTLVDEEEPQLASTTSVVAAANDRASAARLGT